MKKIFLEDFSPRMRNGYCEFPVHYMRGGTSTGVIVWDRFVPRASALIEELLLNVMGSPLAGGREGNKQITGLGRGIPTSNKVFIADVDSPIDSQIIVSTLAQLAHDHSRIDWNVNCGNMSAALHLWALDTGMLRARVGKMDVKIFDHNTSSITISRMELCPAGRFETTEIPGVDGLFPSVDLFVLDPIGTKTGKLLPTGSVRDVIEGFSVSCVDVAVPMVICDASELGKTAYESIEELEADEQFLKNLRKIWISAGLLMGLKRKDGFLMTADDLKKSETIPKICIVGAPQHQGNLSVRYFTPQRGHGSMAVSGGCCLAAAALIRGSVADRVAQGIDKLLPDYSDIRVKIENPAGILDATVEARLAGSKLEIRSAAYRRSAQVLMHGHVPLYRASPELVNALLSI